MRTHFEFDPEEWQDLGKNEYGCLVARKMLVK